MRSGNHLNGFVGSRTSNQSRTQPLNAFRTKNFWYLGDIDEENGDDTIEFIADLSSKCRVRLSSQRVRYVFCADETTMAICCLSKRWLRSHCLISDKTLSKILSSMSFVLTRFFLPIRSPDLLSMWFELSRKRGRFNHLDLQHGILLKSQPCWPAHEAIIELMNNMPQEANSGNASQKIAFRP